MGGRGHGEEDGEEERKREVSHVAKGTAGVTGFA